MAARSLIWLSAKADAQLTSMAGPLEGIIMLDRTHRQMGTVATAPLADFRAITVHIENRLMGDDGCGFLMTATGERGYFISQGSVTELSRYGGFL